MRLGAHVVVCCIHNVEKRQVTAAICTSQLNPYEIQCLCCENVFRHIATSRRCVFVVVPR
jgi:hypothetical protein